MKLNLNRVQPTPASTVPAKGPVNPALQQIFQRLAAAGGGLQKAA